MTTDDFSPMSDDGAFLRRQADAHADVDSARQPSAVDSFASKVVDDEIDVSDVPEDLRQLVIARAVQFTELRQLLLDTNSTMQLDRGHLAASIGRAHDSIGRRGSRRIVVPRRSRASLAVAASVLAALAVTAVVLGQQDSRDEVFVSGGPASVAPTSGVAAFGGSMSDLSASETPGEYDAFSQQESLAAPSSAEPAEQRQQSGLLPEFASADDIRAAADLVAREEALPESKSLADFTPCAALTRSHLGVTEALFRGRQVQIHFLAEGNFLVYDSIDCTVVLSRDGSDIED